MPVFVFVVLMLMLNTLILSLALSLGTPGAVEIFFCPERSGLTRSGCAGCTGGW